MEQVEIFNREKLCITCNTVRKFKITIDKKDGSKKITSKTCLACISKKNNEKLKTRGYYKDYYQKHAEKMKQSDKDRNKKKKDEVLIVLEQIINQPNESS